MRANYSATLDIASGYQIEIDPNYVSKTALSTLFEHNKFKQILWFKKSI